MRLFGNERVWRALVKQLPTAALLTGPDGVGRRYGASGLAEKVSGGHALVLDKLTVEAADQLAAWTLRRTKRRVAVVSAAGASPQGWNRLLKLLEELPPGVHVWIVGDGPVPLAVASRCHVFEFDYLEPEHVSAAAVAQGDVTQEELDLMPTKAFRSFDELARERAGLARLSNVRAWLYAVERKSREELLDSVGVWTASASRLLVRELEAQYDNGTLLGSRLTRNSKDNIIRAIAELVRGTAPKVSALVAGTFLIDQT